MASRTQLVLLGTGTPNADPIASAPPSPSSSTMCRIWWTSARASSGGGGLRARHQGLDPVAPHGVRHAPALGPYRRVPDLIFTPAVLERDAPLQVYGFLGIRAMTDHVMTAWAEDVDVRLHDLETGEAGRLRGSRARGEGWAGLQGRLRHGPRVRGSPWRVEAVVRLPVRHADLANRRVGDSGPSDAPAAARNGCDILVHEGGHRRPGGPSTRPPEWQRYHRAYHTVGGTGGARGEGVGRACSSCITSSVVRPDEGLVAEVKQDTRGRWSGVTSTVF